MANRATPHPLPILPGESSAGRRPPLPAALPDWREPVAAEPALETRLHELADEILLLASGDGVALALTENGEMRCRATSGNITPPLGARIDGRSGLTGACISSGTLLRCDDTEKDERVDREVCRALGVRAIVCVPVKTGQAVTGIFEIFSGRPQAFLKVDVAALHAKAEEIAQCLTTAKTLARTSAAEAAPQSPAPGELGNAWTPVPAKLWRQWRPNRVSLRMWRAVLGVLVLAVGLFLLLRALRGPAAASPPLAAQPVSAGAMSMEVPASAAATPRSEPGREIRRSRSGLPGQRVQRETGSPARPAPLAVAAGDSQQHLQAPQPTPPDAPLTASSAVASPLDQLVSSLPAAQPALNVPRVSTGISQPVLIHRVNPVYPMMARQSGIQGSVVLDGTVDKDGKVSQVRVISGNSLLVAAAVQAVRQWRYQPYQLNGETIQVGVRITLNFELTK